jgi:REP element-mobilizing transposase RayT
MLIEIGAILRELCRWKEVNIIEAEVCPDHAHMLVEMPPKRMIIPCLQYEKSDKYVGSQEADCSNAGDIPHYFSVKI